MIRFCLPLSPVLLFGCASTPSGNLDPGNALELRGTVASAELPEPAAPQPMVEPEPGPSAAAFTLVEPEAPFVLEPEPAVAALTFDPGPPRCASAS